MMHKYTLFIFTVLSLLVIQASGAMARTIHAEWSSQNIPGIAGFRLYHETNQACEVNDPDATSLDCEIDITDGETWFTLTYFMEDGMESAHSSPFTYSFSSDLQASIAADTEEGPAPLEVTFDASASTGNISTYEWMFGDGNTATGTTVTHSFSTQGNYTVTLIVSDNNGATDQENITIVATEPSSSNQPPVAVISSSASIGNAPFLVTFDASGSSDSDGSIVSYSWDMGDGGTATGAQASHTYTVAGTYSPTLTVTDNDGLADSSSTPIIIQPPVGGNEPPTAVISASATQGTAPLEITFSGQDSTDSDGSITSYNWAFGDGSTGSGATVSHTFTDPAEYTVSLTVIDNSSAASQPATLTINVTDPNGQEPPKKINLLPILNLLLLEESNN